MAIRVKMKRRVEVAPGIVNFELAVSNGTKSPRRPKINRDFARLFSMRLQKEAKRIPGFVQSAL